MHSTQEASCTPINQFRKMGHYLLCYLRNYKTLNIKGLELTYTMYTLKVFLPLLLTWYY